MRIRRMRLRRRGLFPNYFGISGWRQVELQREIKPISNRFSSFWQASSANEC